MSTGGATSDDDENAVHEDLLWDVDDKNEDSIKRESVKGEEPPSQFFLLTSETQNLA